MTAVLAAGARTFTSLRIHRNYRLFFSGQIVSVVGTWMQNTALAWFIVDLTHSPLAVGFLAFCRFVPFSIFGLPSGVFADRFDNRRVMMMTQAFAMLVSIALAALAFSGHATAWEAYVLAALGGIALVFDAPNRHALTFQMVGREELPNAVALNASLFNASRVIGPAVAGVLIAVTSVGVCFAINAVSFLAVLAGLALMRKDELFPVARGARQTMVAGVAEGLRYARNTPKIRAVLLMTLVVSTVGFNFHVLVPVLAADTLHVGADDVRAALGGVRSRRPARCARVGRPRARELQGARRRHGRLQRDPARARAADDRDRLRRAAVRHRDRVHHVDVEQPVDHPADHAGSPARPRPQPLPAGLRRRSALGGLISGWLAEVGGTELAFTVAGRRRPRDDRVRAAHAARGAASRPSPVLVPGTRR